jgi:hypothetical protein
MRFSFVNNMFISKHFHSVTIFKLISLWIQFFVKLFFVRVIFSKFSLLKFDHNFERSHFFTVFIWKPINCFFGSFQHFIIKLWLVTLNSHVHFVIFKRFVHLKFDAERFPFVILNHILHIVDVRQSCRDVIFTCDSIVIFKFFLLFCDEIVRG